MFVIVCPRCGAKHLTYDPANLRYECCGPHPFTPGERPMSYGDHQCEVSRHDVDRAVTDERYERERAIEDLRAEVRQLKADLRSLADDLRSSISDLHSVTIGLRKF